MTMETVFRVSVVVLLLFIVARLESIGETADAARVNAARALDRAGTAASNAEQAHSSAHDAHQAALLCR